MSEQQGIMNFQCRKCGAVTVAIVVNLPFELVCECGQHWIGTMMFNRKSQEPALVIFTPEEFRQYKRSSH